MALTGLAAIRAMQEQDKKAAAERERPKAEYFKFPAGVEEVTLRFAQELDEAASGYIEANGIGLIEIEHQAPGPDGYKRRAKCTLEDGACYADERHAMRVEAEQGGWRPRKNFYINALVKVGTDEPKMMVISRNAKSSFVEAVIDEAVEEGTITEKNYRVKKTGTGTSTSWLLKGLKGEPFPMTGEVFDLKTTVIREIPYEKQAEYYGAVYSGVPEDQITKTASGDADPDAAW